MARPSDFSQPIANAICEEIAGGKSLRKICEAKDMPGRSTVFQWLGKEKGFADQYARAREAQADHYADEIVDISDDSGDDYKLQEGRETFQAENVQRSRLRIDARKWHASKLQPKKYGDYQRIDAQVSVSIADRLKDARERAKRR